MNADFFFCLKTEHSSSISNISVSFFNFQCKNMCPWHYAHANPFSKFASDSLPDSVPRKHLKKIHSLRSLANRYSCEPSEPCYSPDRLHCLILVPWLVLGIILRLVHALIFWLLPGSWFSWILLESDKLQDIRINPGWRRHLQEISVYFLMTHFF